MIIGWGNKKSLKERLKLNDIDTFDISLKDIAELLILNKNIYWDRFFIFYSY